MSDYLASRFRLLLLILALLALYGATGVYFFPYLAQNRWLPELARETQLELKIDRIALDPFRLTVRLEGLAIHAASGQALLSAAAVRIRLKPLISLRHWRPAVSAKLTEPAVSLQRDRLGRFSLGGLLPASSGGGPGLPMVLSALVIDAGCLELKDSLRGAPVTTRFQNISASLADFGADPSSAAPVRLSLQGPKDEKVTVTGNLTLTPLQFAGELDAERLNLPFWAATLSPGLDWRIRSGQLTAKGPIHYPVAVMTTGRLVLEGLDATRRQDAGKAWGAGRVELENVRFDPAVPQLDIGAVRLAKVSTPRGKAALVTTRGLTLNPVSQGLTLDALAARDIETPEGKAAAIETGPLAFDPGPAQWSIARLATSSVSTAWGSATQLSVEGVDFSLKPPRLTLQALSAAEINSRRGGLTAVAITDLEHSSARSRVARLTASAVTSPYGDFTAPVLSNAAYQPAGRLITWDELTLQRAITPWGRTDGLVAGALAVDLDTPAFHAGTLAGAGLELPAGRLAALAGEDIAWNGRERRLSLGHGHASGLTAAMASAGRLEAEGLRLDLARQRFEAKAAKLADVIALGVVENEAPEPPPGVSATAPADALPEASRDKTRRAYLGSLVLEDALGDLAQRFFAARRVVTGNSRIDLVRLGNHDLAIRGLPALANPSPPRMARGPAWRVLLDECQLRDYSIHFRDESTGPPVRLRFNGLSLKAFDIDTGSQDHLEFRLATQVGETGMVEAEGRARFNPFGASFRFGIDKLRLRSVEPYWKPLTNADVQRGRLNLWGDAIIRQDSGLQVDYAGAADIVDFEAVDRPRQQPLLKWQSLKFDGFSLSTRPKRFVTRILTAEQPQARITLDESRKLNLLEAFEPPNQAAIPAELEALQVEKTPRNQLPAASIGLLRIKNGTVDFTDRGMTPGFAAQIRHFEGAVTGLSSRADAVATLVLDGRINRNSPVKVFGELEPMDYRRHTAVTLQFKGLNLTTFSAYSGKFGGYRIEKGKLDMDLRYRLQEDRMEAENRAVLDQLTLGERVDESSSWLVDLAIAILKNGEGKIDIDLPITGSLTNPEFSLWTLYRDAFTSLFAKLFYTPASLVNGILGSETRHETLRFAAGQSELDAKANDALKTLAGILRDRPAATLDIRGGADPVQDRLALAAALLLERLKADRRIELRAQGVRLRGAPVPDLTDEDFRRLFTAFYRAQRPSAPELRAIDHDGQPLLSGRLFEHARLKVLQAWPVGETELRSLAQSRAESVRGILIEELGIPDQRIFLRDVRIADYPRNAIETALTMESF